jgi:ATP-dependent helicase HepA
LRNDAAWRIGQFVKIPGWGFGKLRFVDGREATVEFYRSSAEDGRFERTAPLIRVTQENPPAGVRCFFLQDGWWRAGRLLWVGSDEVGVATGDRDRLRLPIGRVYVRCRGGLDDPTDVIRGGVLQDPGHAVARAGFVIELLRHRAAAWGMTGLVSSRIRLFPHQVEVSSRIQRDSVQRYLLADEVGLGKTIEAGIVLRQYLLDHPRETAVVLAPRLLIGQWRQELIIKFGMDELGARRVRFAPHEERRWWRRGPGMVIVDEAHHLAAGFGSTDARRREAFEELCRAAQETERLLLLSATPLLHNERNFLAMLHLLDPTLYPLDGLEEFSARVASRRDFAFRLQAFTPGAPDFVLEEHAEAFRGFFPDDDVLHGHLDALLQAIEEEDAEEQRRITQTTRIHLTETYRLHHRVLRTRRSSPLARDFPVRGRQRPQRLPIAGTEDQALEIWLSAWFDLVSGRLAGTRLEKSLLTAVTGLLDRWRAAPEVLRAYVSAWLHADREAPALAELSPAEHSALVDLALSEAERRHLLELVVLLQQHNLRSAWLTQVTAHIRRAPEKTIVFCMHRATAAVLADELDRQLAPRFVARYFNDETDIDRLERQLHRFHTGTAPYLICDRAGEEGRNLQFAAAMVHVDLPWNPNRLEQRIGRVDRHGDANPVTSFVVAASSATDGAWLRLLIEGYGVFDDSIATLQHVLDGTVEEAIQRLIDLGPVALEPFARELRESLDRERRELAQLENLESIEGENIFGRGLFTSLEAAENREGGLERHTEEWLCSTPRSPAGIGLKLRVDRERVSVRHYLLDPNSNPGMPREIVLRHLSDYLGERGRCTFRRATACSVPGVSLMRPGEPFFDAIEDLTRDDDLGQTFGFWRRDHRSREPVLVAALTFRIEADIDRGARFLANADVGPDHREALQRTVDGFFPPRATTVWLDRDGSEVDETQFPRLAQPFNHRSDYSLGSQHIAHLERLFKLEWKAWWTLQADVAHELVAQQTRLVEARARGLARARTAYQYARYQQHLRLRVERNSTQRCRIEDELAVLDKLEGAVVHAIKHAVPTPEAIGVILLAWEPPARLFGAYDA